MEVEKQEIGGKFYIGDLVTEDMSPLVPGYGENLVKPVRERLLGKMRAKLEVLGCKELDEYSPHKRNCISFLKNSTAKLLERVL